MTVLASAIGKKLNKILAIVLHRPDKSIAIGDEIYFEFEKQQSIRLFCHLTVHRSAGTQNN